MDHYKLFIDGEFVDARDGKAFQSIDPGTGLPFATVAQAGKADAEAAIEAARRAFDRGDWSGLEPAVRAAKIYDFADRVMQQGLRLTVTESMDSGQVVGLSKFMPMLGSGILRNLAYYAATRFPWPRCADCVQAISHRTGLRGSRGYQGRIDGRDQRYRSRLRQCEASPGASSSACAPKPGRVPRERG